ncbi:hypothetical protein GCM10009609_44610 [Pseudonocardia aurantiaca]|uniref:Rhodanese domain-containing protein n=1 Tax=Pseudonocardia aurantiaca TaxID=75290 RepID=A0ABW4FG14_9PSEU
MVGQLADLPAALAARPLAEASSRLTIEQLAELRGLESDLQLIDVRNPGTHRLMPAPPPAWPDAPRPPTAI